MKYTILLFDADDTLFDFQKAEEKALEETLDAYGLGKNNAATALYHKINKQLWIDFEAGKVSKPVLKVKRFTELFQQMGVAADGRACSNVYIENLSKGNDLLPDALHICRELSKTCRLYLVTNGIAKVQHARFEASELKPYFKDIFVSEESGYQKPQVEYFRYVFDRIPDFEKAQALLIGDSLTSDMQGGWNVGLDTCWYNPNHKENEKRLACTYEIDNLKKILEIVK